MAARLSTLSAIPHSGVSHSSGHELHAVILPFNKDIIKQYQHESPESIFPPRGLPLWA